MKIYIRKIDNQCIEKQISYTKEILRDFLDNQADHSTITCVGKQSREQAQVALLLATDPRFDNSIQKILRAEGDLAIGDLMVMYKLRNRYIVELIKPTDNRHASYLSLFENDRHLLMNLDDIETDSDYADIFNHNVYGIHIKEKNDALSEERPHICLGWSAMGDISKLTSKEEIDNRHSAVYPSASSYSRGQDVGQLYRFINEVSIGDYVVFAEPRVCHIGKIISEHYYDSTKYPNQSDDYVNVRDVKWLKTNIKRCDLSRAFHNSLGAGMSFWGINDYKSAVHDLLADTYVLENTELENDILKYDELEAEFKRWDSEGIIKNRTTRFVAFGFKYAESIQLIKGCSSCLKEAVGEDNMGSLIDRGKDLYFVIKNHEIDSPLFEKAKYDFCEELKELPILPKRTRKRFELNSILYGAPGTGKTYATAKYALAIIENKKLDDYVGVSRDVIMNKYNQLIKDKRIVFTTFHQNYGYEDFIQGIRPDTTTAEMRFKTVDGVFKQIAEKAMETPEEDFVIIIDEINRANISKVFGELITLIEDDKRWGEENAVSATLPSGEIFAVPNNLYIVGTMNSADKSISLIDTALRRRFEFVEFVPDLNLISDTKLKKVLEKLNDGISKELNSTDLLVGHSYFINKKADDICTIMNRSIIPLLYEYFFDNKNKVEVQLKSALEGLDVEVVSNTMGRIKIKKKEV